MVSAQLAPNIKLYTNNTFSMKELAFITAYLANGFNGTDAVIEAGYNSKAPDKYG